MLTHSSADDERQFEKIIKPELLRRERAPLSTFSRFLDYFLPMTSDWLHPREELVRTMNRIYHTRMTTTSGGNLSILDPDGSIWITPSRLDKGNLRPSDIVQVMPDGSYDSPYPPSSEFPFHREIYKSNPRIKSIVHAHPGALVAFSICREVPELEVQRHAFDVCRKIAYAPYACPGSEKLGQNIAEAFTTGADCVMLENHGVVVGGTDLQDAFQRFETLEFVAQTLVRAKRLGKVSTLPEEVLTSNPDPGFSEMEAKPPTTKEKELRGKLCEFVHRSYRQRLLISTAGAFSARLSETEFLITPHRRDRLELEPNMLVRANASARESGKTTSRSARLHAAIYEKHPDVGVVILAQPAFASAYCMTKATLDTRTIPESYLVLLDAPKVPFACVVKDSEALADKVSLKDCPVILIENEGALVVGKDLLDAFDRLEVLEATTEALQMSVPLGDLVPMGDEHLTELRQVFGLDPKP